MTIRSQARDVGFRRTDHLARMIVTCANPQCSRSLGHRYEGRIFRLRLWRAGANGVPDCLVRYLWLCVSCTSTFTLVFDERCGVRLARLNDAHNPGTKLKLLFAIATAHFRKHETGWIGNEHESRLGTELKDTEEVHHGRKTNSTRKTRSRR